jgi:hypothetical protein
MLPAYLIDGEGCAIPTFDVVPIDVERFMGALWEFQSTNNLAGCPTACCGEENGAARRVAIISAWLSKEASMLFMA